MHLFKSLLTFAVLTTFVFAQLPKAGTLILSADGTIGLSLGGIMGEEDTYGSNVTMYVTDGDKVVESTTFEYRHFNWSGEMNADVFLGKRFALGLNGGYQGVSQKVLAENHNLTKNTGKLYGLGTVHLGFIYIVPVEDNMFISMKIFGGYGTGKLTRIPVMSQLEISATAIKNYVNDLNESVDVSGVSAGLELKLNIFQTYGLMGSIGLRYGIQRLTGDEPVKSVSDLSGFAVYDGVDTWFNHSISICASVGFGFKMSERLNYFHRSDK